MNVIIRNKLFSVRGNSSVNDENNQPVYNVKGKFFSITNKKRICDMNGNVLYKVRNKFFNFFLHKAYIYDATGTKVAVVKDKLFNFKHEYFVVGYTDEIKLEGKMFSLTCQILKNGECIGTVRRKVDIVDCFAIEAEEEYMPFLVALVIAVDNIQDKIKSKNK